MSGSLLSIASSTLSQKRNRAVCCATVNPLSNSNRTRAVTRYWTMDVPVMRYLDLQRLLLSTLQQTALPAAVAVPKKPKRLAQMTRPLQRPSLRAFVARLPQLVCQASPRLIEVLPDLSQCGLVGAGGLLHGSLTLLKQAAQKHGTPFVIVFASLVPVDVRATIDEMCVLPLCFFLCPPMTPLVSNLSACLVITPDGEVAKHHASLQLFLMVHTGLVLMGCVSDDDFNCATRFDIETLRPGDATNNGLLLHCTVTRRPLGRRRCKISNISTAHIIIDDAIGSSRIVHRSWEHCAPHPVISPANLHYRCGQCHTLCTTLHDACTSCKTAVTKMRSFWMRYTWKAVQ